MKKFFLFAFLFSGTLFSVAQNPVATLEHNGTTHVFYGQGSFVDALSAASKEDTLCLSTGIFTAPTAIDKGVKIFGAGHFPDSANVSKCTSILGGLYIAIGADNLRLEGLYISGAITYDPSYPINYVKVIRCRLTDALFGSSKESASKNYCSYEECFIQGAINFNHYGNNFLVRNSIIQSSIANIDGTALLDGNIFLTYSEYTLRNVDFSLIQNNVFISYSFTDYSCSNNNVYNNLFAHDPTAYGGNASNNYTPIISQSNIFVNQSGNYINYAHDYHLKNPLTYLGTDGTSVGIYGGQSFKDKGITSNPSIVIKNIAPRTDSDGNLEINISVVAQDK